MHSKYKYKKVIYIKVYTQKLWNIILLYNFETYDISKKIHGKIP